MHDGHGIVARITARYFELSYALLATSPEGRALLLQTASIPNVAAHGYVSSDDLDVLIRVLEPTARRHLLDLGCGLGGMAIAVHQQTGVRVTGIDISARAVAVANARAIEAGIVRAGAAGPVAFVRGSISDPPRVGADAAYALDSLMFVPIDGQLLRGISGALGRPARLFATTLAVGREPRDPVAAAAAAVGGTVISSEDVTRGLLRQSRRRRQGAVQGWRHGPRTVRGQLGMLLVAVEETIVQALARWGRLRRWRTVVDLAPGD